MTLSVLDPLRAGPLAPYLQKLLPPGAECDAIPGTELLRPDVLTAAVARFGQRYAGGADRRAVASLWLKHHLAAWLVPGLALNLLRDHDLPLSLDDIGVVLAPEGHTAAIRLGGPGTRLEAGGLDRFATLTERHVAPLVAVLSCLTGTTPRVLWSNAGNVFENVVRQVGQLAPNAPGLGDAGVFLNSRSLRDGAPNPLFQPIRYLPRNGTPVRTRRVCCLRYLIEELDYCSTCPLPRP